VSPHSPVTTRSSIIKIFNKVLNVISNYCVLELSVIELSVGHLGHIKFRNSTGAGLLWQWVSVRCVHLRLSGTST